MSNTEAATSDTDSVIVINNNGAPGDWVPELTLFLAGATAPATDVIIARTTGASPSDWVPEQVIHFAGATAPATPPADEDRGHNGECDDEVWCDNCHADMAEEERNIEIYKYGNIRDADGNIDGR